MWPERWTMRNVTQFTTVWLRRETMTRVKGLAKIKKKIERDVTDSRITTVELCDMTWHWHDMTIMTMTVTVDTTSTRYRVSVWRWTLSSTVSQFNSVTRQSSDTRLYWTVQNTYRYVNGSKLAQLFMLRYKVNTAYVIPYVCSCYHKHTMHCAIFS